MVSDAAKVSAAAVAVATGAGGVVTVLYCTGAFGQQRPARASLAASSRSPAAASAGTGAAGLSTGAARCLPPLKDIPAAAETEAVLVSVQPVDTAGRHHRSTPEPDPPSDPAQQASVAEAPPLLPFRCRRRFNWEGKWTEDKTLAEGTDELQQALGFPWLMRRALTAAPGPTLCVSGVSDDGHSLDIQTNSSLLDKMVTLKTIPCHYGDDEATSKAYEQVMMDESMAPRKERAWWTDGNTLVVLQEWTENAHCKLSGIRGKRCQDRTTMRYDEEAGWLRQETEFHVEGSLTSTLRTLKFLRREGSPPRPQPPPAPPPAPAAPAAGARTTDASAHASRATSLGSGAPVAALSQRPPPSRGGVTRSAEFEYEPEPEPIDREDLAELRRAWRIEDLVAARQLAVIRRGRGEPSATEAAADDEDDQSRSRGQQRMTTSLVRGDAKGLKGLVHCLLVLFALQMLVNLVVVGWFVNGREGAGRGCLQGADAVDTD